MKSFIARLFNSTPKIGRTVRNIGTALFTLNAGALAGPAAGLPEVPDSWLMLANIILAIIMAVRGQAVDRTELHEEIRKPEH
jgi:uncharacterized oligopeptide transporter (OPT) family protein